MGLMQYRYSGYCSGGCSKISGQAVSQFRDPWPTNLMVANSSTSSTNSSTVINVKLQTVVISGYIVHVTSCY